VKFNYTAAWIRDEVQDYIKNTTSR